MWLNDGDANTKNFHISATNRRKRNKIIFFKDESGNWINDHASLSSHVLNYFTNIFTTSQVSTNWKEPNNIPLGNTQLDLTSLDAPLLDIEIKKAIFSFKPFKALGPDGLHPFLYQKY